MCANLRTPTPPHEPLPFKLTIDRASSTPAYLQLKLHLEALIEGGELEPGAPLPSERSLASSLGLSRMTVRRAFDALAEASLVVQRRGSGTYVRAAGLDQPAEHLRSYAEEVGAAGFEPGSKLISFEQIAAGASVAEALDVDQGAAILRLVRLRTFDGEPLEIQDAYLPTRFLALSIVDLTQSGSLYRTLDRQFGVRPSHTKQTVGARLASQSESKYLKLPRDVPVLSKQRITYGLDGRPMEYVICAARSDKYRLVFQVSS